MITIAFETKKLQKICENEFEADKIYGIGVAQILRDRLSDLRASENVTEAVRLFEILGDKSPIELRYKGEQTYQLDLNNGYKLVFCSNHQKPKLDSSGATDWNRINRVKILEIKKNE